MSEIIIDRDYVLARYEHRLRFPDDKPVVIGYCRVSTDEQMDEGYSIENQQRRIREACERRFGRGKFHLIFIIEDATGKLPYDRGGMAKGTYREGLTLVTRIVEKGYAKFVAVYKLNRLIRKTRIWLELDEDYLRPNDVEIFSATEGISNKTAPQRFFTAIIAASAENERENIASVARDGLRARMEQFYYTGQVPFGWRWDDARAPRKERHRRTQEQKRKNDNNARRNIEQDPEAAPYVRKAYDWYKAGKELKWIAEEFEKAGVRTTRDFAKWTAWAIKEIITNPIHAGFVRLDGQLAKGRHFPLRIVEPAEYYAVSERLASQAKIGPRLRRSVNHIFGELTKCGICGRRMLVIPRPAGARYECGGNRGEVRHPGFSVLIERVEKRIVQSIQKLAERKDLLEIAAGKIADIVDSEHGHLERERERLQAEMARKQEDLVRWCERWNQSSGNGDAADEDANAKVFNLYKDRLIRDISELESRLVGIEDQDRYRQARAVQLEQAMDILRCFPKVWDEMDLHEKRTFGSYVIEELSFEPDGNWVDVHLKLILTDPEVHRVPVRGRGGRNATGLDALSRTELTLAYYCIQGCTDEEIAADRDVALPTVKYQKALLLKRCGTKDLAEALSLVSPIVEARKEELLIGRRCGLHYKEHFTPLQIEVLRHLAQGFRTREIGRRIGRTQKAVCGVLNHLYLKLDCHCARDAVAAAQRLHLIAGPNEWSYRPTEKQLAVLKELAAGANQPQAARNLGISLAAVKERMKCMFKKFGLHSLADLLVMANERGWLA